MKVFLPLVLLCTGVAVAQSSPGPDAKPLAQTEFAARDVAETPELPAMPDEVADLIQYLQESPADYDPHQRKIAAKKLDNWVQESPAVNLTLSEAILPYLQYAEARTLFTCGYVQYTVSHPVADPGAAKVAGMRTLMSYYQDNMHILGRDELLDKLVDLRENGRLDGFVRRRVD